MEIILALMCFFFFKEMQVYMNFELKLTGIFGFTFALQN